MKKLCILALSSFALIFADCTPKKATTKVAATTGEVKKNYTPADLADGKMISESNCNKCHKLHQPEEFAVDKWEKIIPSMAKKAKLTDEQTAKVHAYLIAGAKAG